MNEKDVRELAHLYNKDCDLCMEYLFGLADEDGYYKSTDVMRFINRWKKMENTITSNEYERLKEKYCTICKKTCGHYAHEHDDLLDAIKNS